MPYKTTKELAEEFRVAESTIKRKIYAGKIKAIKIGRDWKIPEEEFERLKKEGV